MDSANHLIIHEDNALNELYIIIKILLFHEFEYSLKLITKTDIVPTTSHMAKYVGTFLGR